MVFHLPFKSVLKLNNKSSRTARTFVCGMPQPSSDSLLYLKSTLWQTHLCLPDFASNKGNTNKRGLIFKTGPIKAKIPSVQLVRSFFCYFYTKERSHAAVRVWKDQTILRTGTASQNKQTLEEKGQNLSFLTYSWAQNTLANDKKQNSEKCIIFSSLGKRNVWN